MAMKGNKVNNQDIQVNVEVSGSIAESLAALGKKLTKQVLLDAVKAGATITAMSINQRIPVDTGTLKDSLAIEVASTSKGVSATVGFNDKFQASIGYWIEHGHNNRIAKTRMQKFFKQKGTQIGMVPAHPFFRPGIDAAMRQSSEAVMAVINKALTQDSKQDVPDSKAVAS